MPVTDAYYARFQEPDPWQDSEYPDFKLIEEIARKHLEPAFSALEAELEKNGPHLGHSPFRPAELKQLIEWVCGDGLLEHMDSDYLRAVRGEED